MAKRRNEITPAEYNATKALARASREACIVEYRAINDTGRVLSRGDVVHYVLRHDRDGFEVCDRMELCPLKGYKRCTQPIHRVCKPMREDANSCPLGVYMRLRRMDAAREGGDDY